jgi:hypothetical protein
MMLLVEAVAAERALRAQRRCLGHRLIRVRIRVRVRVRVSVRC